MATDTPIDIATLIQSTPGINGGRPCMAGTGTSVHAVAVLYQQHYTAEQIAAEYPHIPLSHIHAAIAHYLANRARIDAELTADQELNDRLAAEHPRSRPATTPGG